MLPVRDARQQHFVEIAQDGRERFALLGRAGGERRADLARRDPRQHRQLVDPLQIPRRPLEHRGPVAPQLVHTAAGVVPNS
jgi:hypothetical protein